MSIVRPLGIVVALVQDSVLLLEGTSVSFCAKEGVDTSLGHLLKIVDEISRRVVAVAENAKVCRGSDLSRAQIRQQTVELNAVAIEKDPKKTTHVVDIS